MVGTELRFEAFFGADDLEALGDCGVVHYDLEGSIC